MKCKYCGNEILNYNTKLGMYCSNLCSTEYRKWNYEPNHKCSECGKYFYVKPSHIKRFKNISCSKECDKKYRSKIMSNTGNHQYGLKGFENASNVGYRTIHSGYYYVLEPSHPFSDKCGRIREHRFLAEKYLMNENQAVFIDGTMYLDRKLEVHHKDFNKLNNNIDNLEILTKSEHIRLHNILRNRKGE